MEEPVPPHLRQDRDREDPGRGGAATTCRRGASRPVAAGWPALLAIACVCVAGCSPPPRSVLLVTVDTLRADRVSSYGFARPTTPSIDALAADGALFERALAASSSTAPSHASIFTSLYPRQHSIGHLNGDTRLEGGTTLAEAMRGAGYATAAFVGNSVLQRRIGLDRGFDVYDDELPRPEGNRSLVFERRADETAARVFAWLEDAPEPFFVWVHLQDPHGPYDPPEPFRGHFPPEGDPEEPPLRRLETSTAFGGLPAYQALPGLDRASQYRARYLDEIRFADHWIGRILDAPALRDAIVLLTSDHGESLGEQERWFMHGTTTLPPEAHVPLVVRAPGIDAARFSTPVSHVDVMPTLLELAGVPLPDGLKGISLVPAMRGEAALPARSVYCDMVLEASAYGADALVWVRHAFGPSHARAGEHRGARAYRWDGGEPRPASGSDDAGFERLKDEIGDYLEDGVPMVEADDLSDEGVERLRALGYVD